jgi:Neuraminidase (sialidase)
LCLLTLSSAFAQWEPDVRLTNDPADSYLCGQQCIVAVGDTLHVIFTDNRSGWYDVYYSRSTDAGATWDSAVCVSLSDSNRIFSATVAAAGADVHIAWEGRNNGSLQYRHSTDGGATWLPETALVVSSSCGTPFLSADGDLVGLAWGDSRDGGHNGELYYKQSGDDGSHWTGDARLTVDTDSVLDKEACLVVSGNHRYIVWTRYDWNTSVSQTWFMRSTNNGASWEPRARITADTSGQSYPMVAAVGPNVHACWSDGRPGGYGIWHRRSTDNGATWNAEQHLADTTYGSDYPVIATAGGNVHVAYRAWPAGQLVIDYRGSTDNGQTWSAETSLTTVAGMGTAVLAAAGSRAHLISYDNREGNFEIYYKRNLTAGGVEETMNDERRTTNVGRTIIRGVLFLAARGEMREARCELLDVSGRRVLHLKPGANDVSRLAPGVYFIRSEPSAVRRIIVVE